MNEAPRLNNNKINDGFSKKLEATIFKGEDPHTQEIIKQAFRCFLLWNNLTINELNNIKTFKQLVKSLKTILENYALTTSKVFENTKKLLDTFKTLTDSEKIQLEQKYNTLTAQELDNEALKLVKELDGVIDKKTLSKVENEKIYQYAYIEYKITDKTLTLLVMSLAVFEKIDFKNDNNRKKADRLTLEAIETFKSDLLQQETIKKPSIKVKNEYSNSQELYGTNIYNLTTVLGLPSMILNENNPIQLTIINNYKNQVEQKIKDIGLLKNKLEGLDHNSKEYKKIETEITTLTTEAKDFSKNIVKYMGGYYSVDGGGTFKTTIDTETDGFYNLDSESNEHIAILPSRILAKQTRWRQVLDGLIYLCLKDPNNAIYDLDIKDEDIYYIMGETTTYERNQETPSEANRKRLNRAKTEFKDIVANELFLIRLNTKELKGNILSYSFIGDKITITITNSYLNACIKQNIGGIINHYIYEALTNEKDINAINLYKEIAREIYSKTIRENKNIPNEYNYKFTINKLRKMGNYLSEGKIEETTEKINQKQKNKDIKNKIKNDLTKLYENGLILITEIKGKSDFTIMVLNDEIKITDLQEHFKKVAKANGHELLTIEK